MSSVFPSFPGWLASGFIGVFVLFIASADFLMAQAPDQKNSEPRLLSSPDFVLFQEALDAGITGTLLLALKIDRSGNVTDASVIAGPVWPCGKSPTKQIDAVKKLAVSSLRQAKFQPAVKNAKTIGTEIGLRITLGKIDGGSQKPDETEDSANDGSPKIIESGVLTGKALSLPRPEYPAAARSRRLSGSVEVSLVVGEDGRVISAGALNGHPVLQESARDSACGARFTPAIIKGRAVKFSGVITFTFIAP